MLRDMFALRPVNDVFMQIGLHHDQKQKKQSNSIEVPVAPIFHRWDKFRFYPSKESQANSYAHNQSENLFHPFPVVQARQVESPTSAPGTIAPASWP